MWFTPAMHFINAGFNSQQIAYADEFRIGSDCG